MEGVLPMPFVTEAQFATLAQNKLGESWDRARIVFRHYGFNMAFDVMLVLLYAVKQNWLEEALTFLEEHYENYLRVHQSVFCDALRNSTTAPSLTQQVLEEMLDQARELDRIAKQQATA